MRSMIAAFVLGLLAASAAWGVQGKVARSVYRDEVDGYSVEVPRFPKVGPATAGLRAVFSGLATEGVATNLNILVQPLAGLDLAKYRKATGERFQRNGMKVHQDTLIKVSGRDAIAYDYELGTPEGKFRVVSIAVFDRERVILVTGTAELDQFAAVESELRASLASLKFR